MRFAYPSMVRMYLESLRWGEEKIAGQVFKAGFENFTVSELAQIVQRVVGEGVEAVKAKRATGELRAE